MPPPPRLKSPPVRGRGLKRYGTSSHADLQGVAPRAGAWIETIGRATRLLGCFVAPRAGAWIETAICCTVAAFLKSPPVRGRGLKQAQGTRKQHHRRRPHVFEAIPNSHPAKMLSASNSLLTSLIRASLSTDSAELLHVSYSAEKHAFVAGGKEVALDPSDEPTLHAFVDGSVVELILSLRIGYRKRFYNTGETAPDVHAWAHPTGVKMTAWKIMPISQNRLTTPAYPVRL